MSVSQPEWSISLCEMTTRSTSIFDRVVFAPSFLRISLMVSFFDFPSFPLSFLPSSPLSTRYDRGWKANVDSRLDLTCGSFTGDCCLLYRNSCTREALPASNKARFGGDPSVSLIVTTAQ